MRKLILIFALSALVCVTARAGFLFGGVSLTTITTAQTNSPAFYTNSGYIFAPQVTITNAALSISNAYIGLFRFSIDNGTTWFTNSSPVFIPTNTAAMTYVIQPQTFQFPVIEQMLAITNTANTAAISLSATSP